MKQIIIIVACFLQVIAIQAQPSGGSFFLGGTVGFSMSADKDVLNGNIDDKTTQYRYFAMPQAGFFIGERIAIGARIGYSGQTYKNSPAETIQTVSYNNMLSFGPFFRYYVVNNKGGIFIESLMTAGLGNYKLGFSEGELDNFNTYQITVGIVPGIYYFITEKLAVEARIGWLGYSFQTYQDDNLFDGDQKSNYNSTGISINPSSISFGTVFVF
jgi:hypothetical protein